MSEQTFAVPKAARIPPFLPPLFGTAAAVCYAAAMSRDFEFGLGHFSPSSVFFLAAVVFCALGCVLSLVYAASFAGRTVYRALPSPSPLSFFGAFLGAAMCVLIFMQNLLGYRTARAEEARDAADGLIVAGPLSSVKLYLIAAVLGLFLAAALLFPLLHKSRHAWYAVIAALLGVLSVNISMFAAYFDFSVPLNSPVRNFTTLTQGVVLLFLLGEARIALCEDPADLPPAFQYFSSAACAVFGIGIGGGGGVWQILRSFSFGSEILFKTPEPNLPASRLFLYAAIGCIAADRLLHSDIRLLTKEEIAENRRKAKEEKEKKKNKPSAADGQINI